MIQLIKTVFDRLRLTINPEKYWRKKGAKIGSGCEIFSRANLGSEPYLVHIGNHVRITDNVRFVTHDGGIWVLRYCGLDYHNTYKSKDIIRPIIIKDNVHIGLNSVIMPGVTIGENSIIGCGAIVTSDVPPNSVVAGVPAKVIKSLSEYEEKVRNTTLDTKFMMQQEKKEYLLKVYEDYFTKKIKDVE